jgi:hypothetical protein
MERLVDLIHDSKGHLAQLDSDASDRLIDSLAGSKIDTNAKAILISCLTRSRTYYQATRAAAAEAEVDAVAGVDALIAACELALQLLEKGSDQSTSRLLATVMTGSEPSPMALFAEYTEQQSSVTNQRIIISRLHTYLLTTRERTIAEL